MKTISGVLALSIVFAVAMADPDWNAIATKFDEIVYNWKHNYVQATNALHGEPQQDKASEWLNGCLVEAIDLYNKDIKPKVEDKSLTADQITQFRDQLLRMPEKWIQDFQHFKDQLQNKDISKVQDAALAAAKVFLTTKVEEILKDLKS